MEPWFTTAKCIPEPEVEVVFLLAPDFYFGPDTYPALVERKQVESLRLPACVAQGQRVITSKQADAHLDQLVLYYSDVVRAARKNGKDFNGLRNYFWMRLGIFSADEDTYIGFPWLDSLKEVGQVLESLAAPPTIGEVYWNRDQGWEIQIHIDADNFYIQESDPDANEVHAVAKAPRHWLSARAVETLSRSRSVVARLAAALRDDAWTDHRANLSFQNLILTSEESPLP
jgi:hypothetical protein